MNTHLIAHIPQGLKYEAAVSIPALKIVTPKWLEACAQKQEWLPTREFLLEPCSSSNDDDNLQEDTIDRVPLLSRLNEQLAVDRIGSQIFRDCSVFVVGLDDQTEIKSKLCRLLRRGMATIQWNLDDDVTHIIVADGLEEHVR